MRSRNEQRKPPTSYEGSRQKVAVKPQGYAGAPSSSRPMGYGSGHKQCPRHFLMEESRAEELT
ncbi:hypothetical protein SPACI_017590 [Sporomusa acidovorans DSM 3132]|uniref:Uncharacterized protein n=1 Tax=Sporomusa acidovorans (strain ATCC 49682 / DSM 3132 / Mol) TaxID=1123286 RepID=A0ABZ3J103_SPOA4|nr:hypothetical protein SPACI_10780 [Sporomusa acidovorans DSM 3132]SDE50505.1 hypothetical protein SAMN04488499_101514 [Sporomusa acidovorans]